MRARGAGRLRHEAGRVVSRLTGRPRISALGTGALLFEAPGGFTLPVQARIWVMAARLAGLSGVAEAVAGVTNLLLVLDPAPDDPARFHAALTAAWAASETAPVPEGRLVEIPVRYGGEAGFDLAGVAARTGLLEAEVIRRHCAPEYRVFALGSQPGFPYLGGLDPALATPRKATPVLRVPAGTVVIGGAQAGIVASAGPNGWHAIGRTEVKLFDAGAAFPALLAPGDRVRFRPAA